MLLELLHKLERRYALDVRYGQSIDVTRWCSWGVIAWYMMREKTRYFYLKLPSWSYEYSPAWDDYRMGQRALLYIDGHGWRLWTIFRGE